MELWSVFMHFISTMFALLSAQFGLSEAASVITFTLIIRFALMPISLSVGARRLPSLKKNDIQFKIFMDRQSCQARFFIDRARWNIDVTRNGAHARHDV